MRHTEYVEMDWPDSAIRTTNNQFLITVAYLASYEINNWILMAIVKTILAIAHGIPQWIPEWIKDIVEHSNPNATAPEVVQQCEGSHSCLPEILHNMLKF